MSAPITTGASVCLILLVLVFLLTIYNTYLILVAITAFN